MEVIVGINKKTYFTNLSLRFYLLDLAPFKRVFIQVTKIVNLVGISLLEVAGLLRASPSATYGQYAKFRLIIDRFRS